jgi:hypothetical protein
MIVLQANLWGANGGDEGANGSKGARMAKERRERLGGHARLEAPPHAGRAGGMHLTPRGNKRAPRGINEPLRDIYEPHGT